MMFLGIFFDVSRKSQLFFSLFLIHPKYICYTSGSLLQVCQHYYDAGKKKYFSTIQAGATLIKYERRYVLISLFNILLKEKLHLHCVLLNNKSVSLSATNSQMVLANYFLFTLWILLFSRWLFFFLTPPKHFSHFTCKNLNPLCIM